MAGLTGTLPKNTYGDLFYLNNANAGVPAAMANVLDGLGNATGLCISSTQVGFGTTADNGLKRAAAGVLAVTNGGSGAGWMQFLGGEAVLASPFTKNNASLASTNLSFTVTSGRSYRISGCLQISNSTAGEGAQFDFNGGGAGATTFFMSASIVGTAVAGTVVSTSLAGVINWTSVTGTDYVLLNGYLKPSSTGTFILRAAENTTSTGTLTVGAGSWLELTDAQAL